MIKHADAVIIGVGQAAPSLAVRFVVLRHAVA